MENQWIWSRHAARDHTPHGWPGYMHAVQQLHAGAAGGYMHAVQQLRATVHACQSLGPPCYAHARPRQAKHILYPCTSGFAEAAIQGW